MQPQNILKNRYIGKDNTPRVKNSFVALLDILGYEYLVNLQPSKVMDNSLFYKYRKLINDCLYITVGKCGYDVRDDSYSLMEYKVFSDNILIGMPIIDNISYGYQLLNLITIVGSMQMLFANSGVFIRGAITEGGISIDDKMAYGKGLIRAYKLEKDIAVYPRIIIDPKIKDNNVSLFKSYKRCNEKSILMDSDGVLFVNHMQMLLSLLIDKLRSKIFINNRFKMQKSNIEFLLKHFEGNPHVRSKYVWAANYYNYFCSQHAELSKYIINIDKCMCNLSDKYDYKF